jgi:Low-density lipoprotein receptor repeat class B
VHHHLDDHSVDDHTPKEVLVAVDAGHVYWANDGTNTIGRANLDGTGADQIFITGAATPTGVAVDAG